MGSLRPAAAMLVMMLGLAAVRADDAKLPVSTDNIVGDWEPVDKPAGQSVVITFSKDPKGKDDKVKVVTIAGDRKMMRTGTFTIEGDTIHILFSANEKPDLKVTKLTKTEMVVVDEKNRTEIMKRK